MFFENLFVLLRNKREVYILSVMISPSFVKKLLLKQEVFPRLEEKNCFIYKPYISCEALRLFVEQVSSVLQNGSYFFILFRWKVIEQCALLHNLQLTNKPFYFRLNKVLWIINFGFPPLFDWLRNTSWFYNNILKSLD